MSNPPNELVTMARLKRLLSAHPAHVQARIIQWLNHAVTTSPQAAKSTDNGAPITTGELGF